MDKIKIQDLECKYYEVVLRTRSFENEEGVKEIITHLLQYNPIEEFGDVEIIKIKEVAE